MAEVTRIYRQTLPAMKLVGKCYGEQDKVNGVYVQQWQKWFANNWFAPLQLPADNAEPFEDCDAYIGLCRCKEGEPIQYWIGVFLPLDCAVPAGYDSIALPAGEIAVCWIYGKEPDIYQYNSLAALKQAGFRWTADENAVKWCFERYACPRFTTPDEQGNVILDMCFYVQQVQPC